MFDCFSLPIYYFLFVQRPPWYCLFICFAVELLEFCFRRTNITDRQMTDRRNCDETRRSTAGLTIVPFMPWHRAPLIHHKIIPVPFRQPSTVFQPTGAAGEANHVEPGSVPSSLTCNRPTLVSTRRGFAHKIVPNGVQLWRRLCSPLGVPPDDDDDRAPRRVNLALRRR